MIIEVGWGYIFFKAGNSMRKSVAFNKAKSVQRKTIFFLLMKQLLIIKGFKLWESKSADISGCAFQWPVYLLGKKRQFCSSIFPIIFGS